MVKMLLAPKSLSLSTLRSYELADDGLDPDPKSANSSEFKFNSFRLGPFRPR